MNLFKRSLQNSVKNGTQKKKQTISSGGFNGKGDTKCIKNSKDREK
ncbi:MAG: hypothetical protein ACTSUT_14850 [Promethearchaeota archaeon]